MYLFYAFLSAIFAALVAIFAKLGFKNIDTNLATAIRSVVMAIFMIGVVVFTNKLTSINLKNIEGRDWVLIILSGIAGALSWIFYFLALKLGQDNVTEVAA